MPYSSRERASRARWDEHLKTGHAYTAIQSTKPQTLGYSLADSPVGLLAWIYEKLVGWTDAYDWDDDEGMSSLAVSSGPFDADCAALLGFCTYSADLGVNILVLTRWTCRIHPYLLRDGRPMGSGRYSYQHQARPYRYLVLSARGVSPSKIVGHCCFVSLMWYIHFTMNRWVHTIGNVVFESEHEYGGHFASYENPEGLVDDLRKMFGKKGRAFGVVPGRIGYTH